MLHVIMAVQGFQECLDLFPIGIAADRDRILAALSNPQPANSALKDLLKLSD